MDAINGTLAGAAANTKIRPPITGCPRYMAIKPATITNAAMNVLSIGTAGLAKRWNR